MKNLIVATFAFGLTMNTYAYTVLSKLDCSTQYPGISSASYEIRQGTEASQGRSLVVSVTYESEETVSFFQEHTPYYSFDFVKNFVVGEDGISTEGTAHLNAALVTIETKDKKIFSSNLAMNSAVFPLACKKIK
jgi:hypothetical protein